MKAHSLKSALFSLLVMTLAGCAAQADRTLEEHLSDLGYRIGEPVDRIQDYKINGWNYLDDRHLLFDGGPSQKYLITLKIDCSDTRGAEHIGFTSTVSSVTKFDKIVAATPIGPRSCPIESIQELHKK
jgi:hypothetical protein